MDGLSVPCPSCGHTIHIPGQSKPTYAARDKSSFSFIHGILSFQDKKNNNSISSPQVFLPLIKESYQKRKTLDLLAVFLIISLSIGSLFVLPSRNVFPHLCILIAGFFFLVIAHKLIRFDIVRDLFPLLSFQSNIPTLSGFSDFLSLFLDTLKSISIHDKHKQQNGIHRYEKSILSQTKKIYSYQFGEKTQILLFPDQALLLYNGEFQIVGLYSIELIITENMFYSSHTTDYAYRWCYERKDGGPDRRYKCNYQTRKQCRPGSVPVQLFSTSFSYNYKLIVDGICFEGNSSDVSLLNKIIFQWNNTWF